jgi:hypothetical protein
MRGRMAPTTLPPRRPVAERHVRARTKITPDDSPAPPAELPIQNPEAHGPRAVRRYGRRRSRNRGSPRRPTQSRSWSPSPVRSPVGTHTVTDFAHTLQGQVDAVIHSSDRAVPPVQGP